MVWWVGERALYPHKSFFLSFFFLARVARLALAAESLSQLREEETTLLAQHRSSFLLYSPSPHPPPPPPSSFFVCVSLCLDS